MDGLARAQRALAGGDPRKARDRLKGLVASCPGDIEARTLLAEAYRRDGQPTENRSLGLPGRRHVELILDEAGRTLLRGLAAEAHTRPPWVPAGQRFGRTDAALGRVLRTLRARTVWRCRRNERHAAAPGYER